MTTMKNMCKFLPKESPMWMREAMGMAVWCEVSNGHYAWIKPEFDIYRQLDAFVGVNGKRYMEATPVTDKKILDRTEGMR